MTTPELEKRAEQYFTSRYLTCDSCLSVIAQDSVFDCNLPSQTGHAIHRVAVKIHNQEITGNGCPLLRELVSALSLQNNFAVNYLLVWQAAYTSTTQLHFTFSPSLQKSHVMPLHRHDVTSILKRDNPCPVLPVKGSQHIYRQNIIRATKKTFTFTTFCSIGLKFTKSVHVPCKSRGTTSPNPHKLTNQRLKWVPLTLNLPVKLYRLLLTKCQ